MNAVVQNRVARAPTPGRDSTYETAMAAAVGARHALAFSHGRVALRSILQAAGLRPGDEVVLSPLTCKVVPLTLLSLGLSPVYADVDPDSLNLAVGTAAAALTKKTRAILFQCTYGSMAGRHEVAALASHERLLLIEDRAQCMPVNDHSLAGGSVAAIYSNNLTKPLPAGSGGVAVTNDDSFAQGLTDLRRELPAASRQWKTYVEGLLHRWLLRPFSYWWLLRLQRALDKSYKSRSLESEVESEVTRVASRISEYQGRLGLDWLDRLDQLVSLRSECCSDYERRLGEQAGWSLPAAGTDGPLYYYPVLVADKQALLDSARRNRLELVAWPTKTPIFPVDDPDCLATYGYQLGRCEVADRLSSMLVGLPTHGHVTASFRRRLATLIQRAHEGSPSSDAGERS